MLDTFASNAPGQIFYISLAPQAPYFMEGRYPQIYIALFNSSVRNGTGCDHIDFLNVEHQFFLKADGWSPGTALLQITQKGIPINKLLVRKPVTRAISNTGYVVQDTLANIFKTAHQGVVRLQQGWRGDEMAVCQQYHCLDEGDGECYKLLTSNRQFIVVNVCAINIPCSNSD